jgi:type II secretory pathway pseudopilin PulG
MITNKSKPLPSNTHQQPTTTTSFTIVELLVVIVVIGILAAVTLISYTGVSQRAISASLQSDLTNASTQLKMFQVDNGNYPNTISTNCATNPTTGTNLCLRISSGNTYTYTSSAPYSSFTLVDTNTASNTKYQITDSTGLVAYVSTSILTHLSPATIVAGVYPQVITISSDSTSVYVTNYISNTISMYQRN